jgi:CheY-like chemotaxis protein
MSASAPILLVEDNVHVLDVTCVLLEAEGYAVITAVNGADALARLRAGLRPALIVLDLSMPVMDGWEFRRAQRADPELRDIPTIVYSAIDPSSETVTSLAVAGVFAKGGDPGPMLDRIAALCGRC